MDSERVYRWQYDQFAGINENWTDIKINLKGSSCNPGNQNGLLLVLYRKWPKCLLNDMIITEISVPSQGTEGV